MTVIRKTNLEGHSPLEELFSVAETAQKLGGISPWTVRAWISQGRLEKTKVGARTMVSVRAMREFLNQCAELEMRRLTSDHNGPGLPAGPPQSRLRTELARGSELAEGQRSIRGHLR